VYAHKLRSAPSRSVNNGFWNFQLSQAEDKLDFLSEECHFKKFSGKSKDNLNVKIGPLSIIGKHQLRLLTAQAIITSPSSRDGKLILGLSIWPFCPHHHHHVPPICQKGDLLKGRKPIKLWQLKSFLGSGGN